MARPKEKNFGYFPHDCFAHQDRKLRKVMRKYGPTASAVFSEILSVIYRGEGYYCKVDNDLFEDVAEAIFCPDSNLVAQIINDFVQAGLFDQNIYNRKRVLTSAAVQKRVLQMAVWRKDYQIDPELLLVAQNKTMVNQRETLGKHLGNPGLPKGNQDKTMGNPGLPPGKPPFPSPKEKKRKEKAKALIPPLTPPFQGGEAGAGKKPENLPEEPTETPEPDFRPLGGSLTRDCDPERKVSPPGATGSPGASQGDYRDCADSDPVSAVVVCWNEIFKGTKGEYRQPYISGMLRYRIEQRLKLDPDLQTYRAVFSYARKEFFGEGANNHQYAWTLPAVFNKEDTFDQLNAKANMPTRKRADDKRVVRGYSDPTTYASAEDWANFGKEKNQDYATT